MLRGTWLEWPRSARESLPALLRLPAKQPANSVVLHEKGRSMNAAPHVAVVGATGAVGQEILQVLLRPFSCNTTEFT